MYNIILFLTITVIVYLLILFCKRQKIVFNKKELDNIMYVTRISKYLEEMYKRNIISHGKKYFTTTRVLIICIILFVISVLTLYFIIGIFSTSVILSLPVLISPIILSKILIRLNKRKIIRQLPMYAVNIKNHMTEENNIVSAIMKSKAEEPLQTFIEKFKHNVSRGMNVIQAFDMLKKEVDIKEFNDLISSFELCYKNGGNFVIVLEKYILIVTKESTYKESTEEKAMSSILTLIIMLILNIIVILFFVLGNEEYAEIVRGTFVGQMILNFNAVSYMVIAWLISKIYKEE